MDFELQRSEECPSLRLRVSKLTRMPPSLEQPQWWYVSPEAYSIGPFGTEEDMEYDIWFNYDESAE